MQAETANSDCDLLQDQMAAASCKLKFTVLVSFESKNVISVRTATVTATATATATSSTLRCSSEGTVKIC